MAAKPSGTAATAQNAQYGRPSSIQAQGGTDDFRSLYADLSADPSDTLSLRLNMGNEDKNSFRDHVSGNRQLFAQVLRWC